MVSAFESLGLLPQLMQAVEQMGFEEPTAIQQAAIPALLSGRNIIGQAQTGTGKTAAFVIPMLQKLVTEETAEEKRAIRALVLAPTRELAIQVASAAGQLARFCSKRVTAVYGGQSYTIQTRQIQRGVDIIVGTPGRLIDLMNQKVLDLSQVNYLILDEADEMLEMGFVEDVETILAAIPASRQAALFSATMPTAVRKLADKYLQDPQTITINPSHVTVTEIEQRFYRMREESKIPALSRLLEMEELKSALIFTRTKARAQELADHLAGKGFSVEALHGDLNQARREYVLNRFRSGAVTLLVATDVAARGLDIEDISHVINFDAPQGGDDYVHRIGRTGRAGRKGTALTFFTPRERGLQGSIEAFTHQKIGEHKVPTLEEIQTRRDERFLQRFAEQLAQPRTTREQVMVTRLQAGDFSAADIAAAAIQLLRAGEPELVDDGYVEIPAPVKKHSLERRDNSKQAFEKSYGEKRSPSGKRTRGENQGERIDRADRHGLAERQDRAERPGRVERLGQTEGKLRTNPDHRPERHDRGDQARSSRGRQTEPGMVRLVMNLGKTQGLRPSDVVGAIATEAGIPGRAIGCIDIFPNHTFVDVSEQHVSRVLQKSHGTYHLRGEPVQVMLAD